MKTTSLIRIPVFLGAILYLCGYALASNPDPSLLRQSVSTDKSCYIPGDKIKLGYTLEYEGKDEFDFSGISVSLPAFDSIEGIKLLFGPALSTSSNYTVTNGVTTRLSRATYLFALRGLEVGDYALPDFIVTDRTAAPVALPPVHAKIRITTAEGSEKSEDSGNKTLVVASLGRDTLKLGSSTVLTYRLLSNECLKSVKFIDLPGVNDCFLTAKEIYNVAGSKARYKGCEYNEYIIGKYEITPLKAAVISIPPVSVECTIPGKFTDVVFNGLWEEKADTITSNSLTLTVEK